MSFLRRAGGALIMAAIVWVLWIQVVQPELASRWDRFGDSGEASGPSKPDAGEPDSGSETGTVKATLKKGLAMLRVEKEDRQTYERSLFGRGWIDADDNCRDTRQEVLARESLVPVSSNCRIFEGKWYSYYDDATWTKSFEVQIDHLVPLAEAWDSGAFAWNKATRIRFANDLGDPRALVPTSTALNQSKVADDPQWYIPDVNRCRYISSWIAVKLRWNLSIDEREKQAMAAVVQKCPKQKLTVKRATLGLLPFAAGTGTASKAITIESVTYAGRAEVVVLKNASAKPVRLRGWVLTDEIGYGQFRMPTTKLGAGNTISIRSSGGSTRVDDSGNITQYADWGDVWNNSGDIAILIDGQRTITDRCEYRGDSSGKVTC